MAHWQISMTQRCIRCGWGSHPLRSKDPIRKHLGRRSIPPKPSPLADLSSACFPSGLAPLAECCPTLLAATARGNATIPSPASPFSPPGYSISFHPRRASPAPATTMGEEMGVQVCAFEDQAAQYKCWCSP
ncbi:hypothetical protein LZ32DRAFT_113227 [Colletotrichum eremochloae]|nr:hypothetical protein LZ32DRAFT_113227 [Colletotrichum eremochloae]